MSINLRFQKGSLNTQVTLKDEALADLLKIIAEHQCDAPSAAPEKPMAPIGDTVSNLNDPSQELQRTSYAKSWIAQHSGGEIITKIAWETFPERILLLGARQEMTTNDNAGWRSADIESQFKSARIPAPGNFPRDISKAIKAGIIATVTPRTYKVSKTGWLKIYEAIIKLGIPPAFMEAAITAA